MTDNTSGGDEFAQFRNTFFEECTELLADLDDRLVLLQDEVADQEELNAIFRAVHSIKAGAGAFGFQQLVGFSHKYEALLDWLRDGRIQQDERVASVLIRAGDILASLVEAAQAEQAVAEDYGWEVAAELETLLEEAGRASSDAGDVGLDEAADGQADQPSADGPALYRIGFNPHAELFRHANEPLLLIRELKQLGELAVTCDVSRLPNLAGFEADDSYLSWEFELTTDKAKEDIAEVFEFVDEDCDLTIELVADSENTASTQMAVIAVEEELAQTNTGADLSKPGAMSADKKTPTTADPAAAGRSVADKPKSARASSASSIRVDLARVDRLVNVVGELVITQSMLAQQNADQKSDGSHQSTQGYDELAMLTRELQECVMAIRMQAVKSVFARMPRLVRELSGKLGKKINLRTSGEHTEVDKTIIEELADPLTHMLRNSIDHGLEMPEERLAAGKPEMGTIDLSAAHVGANIVINISDDGAGINRERVLAKAREKGIVAPDAQLADQEIDDLIFAPGFSTAEEVTDISGRGVGMDVVRRNIVSLGGRIQVQSQPGKGTRFNLLIPLTLAVLDGMIVAVGNQQYILPITSIVESFRPAASQIRWLNDMTQVVSIRGDFIRIVRLSGLFNVRDAIEDPSSGMIVLVEVAGGEKIGVIVDELIGQQQIVIKSLNDNFDPVPGISGATILGNGKVALILDIEQLAGMKETSTFVPPSMEQVDAPPAITAAE